MGTRPHRQTWKGHQAGRKEKGTLKLCEPKMGSSPLKKPTPAPTWACHSTNPLQASSPTLHRLPQPRSAVQS